MPSDKSLMAYADRRARLAGSAVFDFGNPWFAPLDQLQAEADRDGRPFVSFANYDYLGLADHPAIKNAAHSALDKLGVGALGSRLVGGERLIHADFEDALAKFVGADACLTLVSGYLTNLSTISHLMGRRDVILYDELSHNSIVSGISGAKAASMVFRHNDMDHLESILKETRANYRNCLIVVESLYSMDGDIANLPELLALKDKFGCWLLVDEAHSIGVLGKNGRGLSEHFGEDPRRIDIIIGTLSKTFASCGGFICTQRSVLEWMRYTLPGFVYSVGLPPVIAAAAHAALDLIVAEPERVTALQANAQRFLKKARAANLLTSSAVGQGIIPVLFPDLKSTMEGSDFLLKHDVFAPPIVQLSVPKELPRIRFFLSARHTSEDIDRAVDALENFFAAAPAGAREHAVPALDAARV
ncbi:MAG: aminotransferase class I/II-fold pyridoxal phosphate-dependent enzyme [Alphaproteobacteria bacterium]|nr:aminotransferase class I/II-fold pyridoxal phosphate-dependent enzyme [Alphaproteobacteria bacterium]MDE2110124.1 aminotransferase class I/II-fold pyridoxal phosphate-dependent enzyme [Alphaproteobacteria bacterium]MDE2492757.1 aminotransferase class I/II-fold pyridoxal phosphate-dependent enzyme [Alphaproteobacteria bacterium]